MSEVGKLLVRVDAGQDIGFGHFVRCFALAQDWRDRGGDVVFVLASEERAALERVQSEEMRAVVHRVPRGTSMDWDATLEVANELSATAVVLDGYVFGWSYQLALQDFERPLLVVDDYGHAEAYVADYVLNQNPGARPDFYRRRSPHTRLLLGERYILLRREFRTRPPRDREFGKEDARRVLITFGGSDQEGMIRSLVRSHRDQASDRWKVTIIGGPTAPQIDQALASDGVELRIERDVTKMRQWMEWADIAVTGAGTTCWELAYLGVPMIIVEVARNQSIVVDGLSDADAAIYLGRLRELSAADLWEAVGALHQKPGVRAEMSGNARALVDGGGVRRVVDALLAC